MKRHSILLVLACLATPVAAEEPRLAGMAEAVLASEWADPVTIEDHLFEPISFDDPRVETGFLLDASPLATVQSAFGGVPASQEIFEGTPVSWLCYDTGSARTTFAALRLAGEGNETIEPGPVLGVIIEEANAPAAGCTANASAAAPRPGNDIPGLGATLADLVARFGSAPLDAGGHLAYVSHATLGDEESWIEDKIVYYRLEGGIVTGIAYRLTTTPQAG